MDESLGRGYVEVEVRDNAAAELARIEAEFKAAMESIGREKAEIQLKADNSELLRSVAESKAALRDLQAEERRLAAEQKGMSAEQKALGDAQLQNVRQRINAQRSETAALENQLGAQRQMLSSLQSQRQLENAVAKERSASAKADAAASKVRQDAATAEHRAAAQAIKDQQDIIRLKRDFSAAEERANALAKQGSSLASQAQRFQLSGIGDRNVLREKMRVDLDTAAAKLEMEKLRLELEAKGARPVHQKVDLDTSGVGGKLREMNALLSRASGVSVGGRAGFLGIGPLNATIGQLVTGIGVALPLVQGLAGGIGSLIAVAGAGLAGAVGVGGAALAGFGMAALGVGSVIKPMISQIAQARQAQTAYTTAVQQYGKNSAQAHTALLKQQAALKGLPPVLRDAVKGLGQVSSAWQRATQGTGQRDLGSIISQGIKTARADMGFFAHDTNQAMNAATAGVNRWLGALRSPAAQNIINNIFSNFNKSIPNIMAGLGSLGAALGRIFSSFSNYLPSLSGGFAKWAQSINNAAQRSGGFANGVARMVGAMRSMGSFLQSATRLLITFFTAGVGPGISMLARATSAMNRWNAALKTPSGQRQLQAFFKDGATLTGQFVSSLLPLIHMFFQLGQAMTPITKVTLAILGAFTKLIGAVATNPFVQLTAGALGAIAIISRLAGGIIGAAASVGRLAGNIKTFFGALSGGGGIISAFKTAFTGGGPAAEMGAAIEGAGSTAAAEMAAGIEGAGSTVAAELAAAMAGGEAAGAAGGIAGAAEGTAAATALAGGEVAVGTEAAVGTAEVAGLGAAVVAAAPELLALAAGAGIVAGAIALFGHSSDAGAAAAKALAASVAATHTAFTAASQGTANLAKQYVGLRSTQAGVRTANQSVAQIMKTVNQLQAEGKTHTQEYQDAVDKLNAALDRQHTADVANVKQREAVVNQQKAINQASQTGIDKAKAAISAAQKQIDQGRAEQKNLISLASGNKDVSAGLDARTKAEMALQQAQNASTLATFNEQRAQKGLAVLRGYTIQQTQQYAAQVAQLKNMTQGSQKAWNFVINLPHPANILQIEQLMAQLRNQPDIKKSVQILANSKNADQAIARLRALVLTDKKMTVRIDQGNALAILAKIRGINLPPKTQRLLHEGDQATIDAVNKIRGLQIPTKILRILGNTVGAVHARQGIAALPDIVKHLNIFGIATDALRKHLMVQNLSDIRKALRIFGVNSDAMNKHAAVVALSDVIRKLTYNGDVGQALAAAGQVASAPNITRTLTYVVRVSGGLGAIGSAFHLAQGGMVPAAPSGYNPNLTNRVAKAAVYAALKPTQETMGGKYNQPTFLIGEENRPEYVIATNPTYREENVGYLQAAAKEFGMRVVSAAKGFAGDYGYGSARRRNKTLIPVGVEDRIGPVDTSDIEQAISDDQQKYNTMRQKRATILKYNDAEYKKKGHGHPKPYPGSSKGDPTGWRPIMKLGADLNQLKQFLKVATAAHTTFDNLESEISTINTAMDTAQASPDGRAEFEGREYTWAALKAKRDDLDREHTDLLRKAFDDAKKMVGGIGNAPKFEYVRALENALGQSILTQTQDYATQGAAPPQSVSDYIAATPALQNQLNKLLFNQAFAQAFVTTDNPATAAREDLLSQQPLLGADKALMDYYQMIAGKTMAISPTNYPLVTDALNAFTSARDTYNTLLGGITGADTSGPTMTQLANTAAYGALGAFASNVNPVLTAGAPSGMLGGAQPNPVNTPTTHYEIHNHFSEPPADPHSWSQGISWELGAAL